jgi:hypothetical protein
MFLSYNNIFSSCIILKESLQIIYIKIKNLNYLGHKFLTKIRTNIMLKFIRVDCTYTDQPNSRRMPSKLVPTLADRGCRVVSVTDPYGC